MSGNPGERSAIRAAAALADPTRRTLYDLVAASPRPVARDEAAAAVGVGVSLAAFHLDRLADAGLLAVEYRRRGTRRGPGAGRPAKLYRRAEAAIDFSLPARRYELAASLLAQAVAASDGTALDALLRAARAWGHAMAVGSLGEDADVGERDEADPVLNVLAACGFAPVERAGSAVIELRNCPFDAIARTNRAVACPMNQALLEGLAEGLGGIAVIADATPRQCCAAIRRLAAGEHPA